MIVFSKEWFIKYQKTLLFFCNTPILSLWFRYILRINGERSSVGKRKISRIEPHAITWENRRTRRKIYLSTEFRTHNKFAKRLYFAFKPLWYLLHSWDWLIGDRFVPNLSFGLSTLTVFPDAGNGATTVDGEIRHGGVGVTVAFSTLRDQDMTQGGQANVAADPDDYASLITSTTTDQFKSMERGYLTFDTSSLTALVMIGSATLSLRGTVKANPIGSPDLHIAESTQGAENTLSAAPSGDWLKIGRTSFGSVAYLSYSTSAYNAIVLNSSGLANISLTGISKFSTQLSWDINGSYTGVWASAGWSRFEGNMADAAGTTTDPKLVVTYSIPVPPRNIGFVNYGKSLQVGNSSMAGDLN